MALAAASALIAHGGAAHGEMSAINVNIGVSGGDNISQSLKAWLINLA